MAALLATTGDAVVRVLQDGDGWSSERLVNGIGAMSVAVDPRDPQRIFAGSTERGLWRSTDGGASFEDAGLPEDGVFSVAVGPIDGAVYAGCEPSMLFRSRDGGMNWEELSALREIPSAPTWSFPPRPWTSHVRWIAPSPHDGDRLLVGIELGGVMLSEDGGETWKDHRPGAQPDCHALAWHPSVEGRAYEAAGGGAAWSSDGGETWRGADEGRELHYAWALAADPADPERWYLSAAPGPMQAHRGGKAGAHLYRWQGEGPWERLTGGLPDPLDSMPYALAATDAAVYAGLTDGRLYRSSDRGDSWESLAIDGDPPERVVALAPVPDRAVSG
jgi:photosystem II stability/assembly factor-like uncharacterized protein